DLVRGEGRAVCRDDLSHAADRSELRAREARDVVRVDRLNQAGTAAEPIVDRRVELSLDDEVDDERGGHDGERHRGCGDESGPGAERHRSRRAYPTPRMVWINRGLPPASVLRRR